MAQGKFTEKLIRMRCEECKRVNYNTRKNKKQVQRKIEYKKFCKWCVGNKVHKESRK